MASEVNMNKANITNTGRDQYIMNTIKLYKETKIRVKLPYRHGLPGVVKNFQGRDHTLNEMHSSLNSSSSTMVCFQTIVGLGGVGKTETVKHYAHKHQKDYQIIIFVVAEDMTELRYNFLNISKEFYLKIDHDESTRQMMDKLYAEINDYSKALIIFDNAEEPQNLKDDFLPRHSKQLLNNIKIIITSRTKNWGVDIEPLPLDVFSEEDAVKYVKETLKDHIPLENEYTNIRSLVKVMGRLPLALKQAVAFIQKENEHNRLYSKNKIFTVNDYLSLFNKERDELLGSGDVEFYNATVRTTWIVTLEKIKENNDDTGRRAIEILEMIGYLLPDNIPFKKLFQTETSVINNEAISLLENYSLVNIDNDYINIHRLVQSVIQLEVEDEKMKIKEVLSLILNFCYNPEIKTHYHAVLKCAVIYNDILVEFYNKLPKSPLIEMVENVDFGKDIIKKVLQYEQKMKNVHIIEESIKILIQKRNLQQLKLLWSLIVEELDDHIIVNLLYYALHKGNQDEDLKNIIAFLLNEILGYDIKFNLYQLVKSKLFHKVHMDTLKENLCDYFKREGKESLLFILSAEYGWSDVIKEIMNTGKCNEKMENDHGSNALHLACEGGNYTTVRLLIEKFPFDLNKKNNKGNTPFMIACEKGSANIVRIFINLGKYDINMQNQDGENALHLACKNKNSEVIFLLVKNPLCDYNVQDFKGDTPFIKICERGWIEIVEMIVESDKCDYKLKNDDGDQALHMALKNKKNNVIKYLIDKLDWDFNLPNNEGRTPLIIACEIGMYDVVEKMTSPRNKKKYAYYLKNVNEIVNAIHSAIKYKNSSIFSYLQDKFDIDLNKNYNKDCTIFMYVCEMGLIDFIKRMPENNLKRCIDIKNKKGENAFDFAFKNNNSETLFHLIHESDLNFFCKNDIFIKVCERGWIRIVDKLIDSNECIVNIQNDDGEHVLHIAIKNKNSEVINRLIESYDWDFNVTNNEDRSSLMIACEMGLTDVVKKMINSGTCNVDFENMYGENAIHFACRNNNSDIIQFLFDKYSKYFDVKNKNGCTPFMIACQNGCVDVVYKLITYGKFDVKLTNNNGDNAAHMACKNENSDVFYLLMKKINLDFNVKNKDGYTPFLLVCERGWTDIVRIMLNSNNWKFKMRTFFSSRFCDVNVENCQGENALHLACKSGNDTTVRLVEKYFPDKNIQNRNGDTPLMMACRNGYNDIVNTLISSTKCNFGMKNLQGDNALHLACKSGNDTTVHLIEEYFELKNDQNVIDYTPLMIACDNGCDDIVNTLISSGNCGENMKNFNGENVLHIACKKKNINIMCHLFKRYPSEFVVQDKDGHTPFMLLCKMGMNEFVKKMIASGKCHMYIKNVNGENAIHLACRNNHCDVVRLLYDKYSCYFDVKNKNGYTPFLIACRKGCIDVVNLMIAYGIGDVKTTNDDNENAFQLACYNKNNDVIHALIKRFNSEFENDNVRNKNGYTIFMKVCERGWDDVVEKMIDSEDYRFDHENCKFENDKREQALHLACKNDNVNVIHHLIRKFSWILNFDVKNRKGYTPVMLACKKDHFDILKKLIATNKCDLNLTNNRGENIFHIACDLKTDRIARYFLDNTAYIKNYDLQNNKKYTPAMLACKRGHIDIIDTLISTQKCDFNFINGENENLLHIACKFNHINIVRLLIENSNCDIDRRNKKGYTPIMLACKNGQFDICKMLISIKKCCVETLNDDDENALHIACNLKNDHILRLLMKNFQWDFDQKNKNGYTPIMLACKNRKTDIVNTLISTREWNVNLTNDDGDNVLHIACKNNLNNVVRLLINEFDWNFDDRNRDGNSPLMLSCRYSSFTIINTLLDQDSDINIQNESKQTALHIFLTYRIFDESILKTMLSKNPDLNILDENGETPIDICRRLGKTKILELLESHIQREPSHFEFKKLHQYYLILFSLICNLFLMYYFIKESKV